MSSAHKSSGVKGLRAKHIEWTCRSQLKVSSAIVQHKKLHERYNAQGERMGSGPTFLEYLESAEGQAELQALQDRVRVRLQNELKKRRQKHG